MGALHSGHLSLVKKAVAENEHVVVSIFVNPTQFNNPTDLEKYPRTLEKDLQALSIFADQLSVVCPSVEEMYGDRLSADHYELGKLAEVMEGKMRPGHFQGVATIVEKLFKAVRPQRAYFGEKDFQQLMVIRHLVELKAIPVEIIQCPIERESNGLARSSRNELLSLNARKNAGQIYAVLQQAKADYLSQEFTYEELKGRALKALSQIPDSQVEYFVIANENDLAEIQSLHNARSVRAFVAVNVEKIRLIDTMNYQE